VIVTAAVSLGAWGPVLLGAGLVGAADLARTVIRGRGNVP